jgi:hypothetical protein
MKALEILELHCPRARTRDAGGRGGRGTRR